jgi:hypothetical protein
MPKLRALDAALASDPAAASSKPRSWRGRARARPARTAQLGHVRRAESIGGYERWLPRRSGGRRHGALGAASAALGSLGAGDCERIERLLERAGLPIRAAGVDAELLLERMQLDKKADKSGLKLILLEGIGRAVVKPAPDAKLLRAVLREQLGS